MAKTKQPKVIGFEIPLKSRTSSASMGVQKITFSNQNKFLIGKNQDGSSLASVEFIDEKPYLILDPKKLNLNFEYGWTVTKEGSHAYLLSNLEIDSDNNIKLTLTSPEKDVFSNIQFLPNEVIVTKQNNTIEKHQVPTLDLDLPQNLFELTQEKEAFVKIKSLPAQFMGVMKDLKNTSTLNLYHKGKQLTFGRVENGENPIIYIVNGAKMTQHSLSDFYIYLPNLAHEKGFLGIKTNKTSTSAYGLKNVDKNNLDKILKFVNPQQTADKITMLTKEQLQEQVLKARTLSSPKIKNKFATSFISQKPLQKQLNEEIVEEIVEDQPKKEPKKKETDDFELGAQKKETDTDDETDETFQAQNEEVLQAETEEPEIESPLGFEKPEEKAKPEKEIVEEPTAITEEKPEENAKTPPAKAEELAEEKTKTVDLSDLAKVFGVGLFLFGLFTGFGGILISILAVGIGSQTIAFNSKFKKIPLPKGPKPLKQELEKNKKNGKLKEVNVASKSTAKEETKIIDHLQKNNLISGELALEAKNIIVNFEKTAGLINKVGQFYEKQINKLENVRNTLETALNMHKGNHKYNQALEVKNQLEKLDKGLVNLKNLNQEFETFKNIYAKDLETQYKVIEDYYQTKEQIQTFEKEEILQKNQELENQLNLLNSQKESHTETLYNQLERLETEKDIYKDFEYADEAVQNKIKKDIEKTNSDIEKSQERITQINSTIEKLESENNILKKQVKDNQANTEKVEYLEQTILNPKVIEQLKTIMVAKTKESFKQFYTQSEKLQDSYKKYSKLDKNDFKLASEVKDFSNQEM